MFIVIHQCKYGDICEYWEVDIWLWSVVVYFNSNTRTKTSIYTKAPMEMPASIFNFLIPWHLKIKISCHFPVDCGNTYIVFPYIWGRICGSPKFITQRTDYWLLWNSTWRFNKQDETSAHPKNYPSLVQSEWNLNFKFLK